MYYLAALNLLQVLYRRCWCWKWRWR